MAHHKHLVLRLVGALFLAAFYTCAASDPSHYGNTLASLFTKAQDLVVDEITYDCDTPLSRYEFFYLTELKREAPITQAAIDHAHKKLLAKKRFGTIIFEKIDSTLHVTLRSQWIFNKLSFNWFLMDSSTYAQLYQQQPGEIFDAGMHEESLQAIQQHLKDHGYFDGTVTDHLGYSHKAKTINVRLAINKRQAYAIEHLHVIQKDAEHPTATPLLAEAERKIRNTLVGLIYNKKELLRYSKKIKRLLRRAGFTAPRIFLSKKLTPESHTATIVLRVHTGNTHTITLEGNQILSDRYIKHDVIAQQIPAWLFSPDIVAQQLLHAYYKKGYWRTKIAHKKSGPDAFHFTITEGAPVTIAELTLNGLDKTPTPPAITDLITKLNNKPADQDRINAALDQLRATFLINGFWDFDISNKDIVKSRANGTYKLKLTMSAGPQRLWSGYKVKDYPELDTNDFFAQYKLQSPCNMQWIAEQRQFLINHFQLQGYWYVDAHPEITAQASKNQRTLNVFVAWIITPGPQVTFGSTVVRGHTVVPFRRIQQQLVFHEGQPWNRKHLELTRTKLKALDVFKSIQVQPSQMSKKTGKKTMMVTLVDDDPLELRAQVGYFFNSGDALFQQQQTPKLGASCIIRNPTRRADKLTATANWNKFKRRFEVAYQQPLPLGLPGIGKAHGYLNKLSHPVDILKSGSAYRALIYGVKFSLNDSFQQRYFWGLSMGNEWDKITKTKGDLKLDPNLINVALPFFFVEPTFTIDTTDDRINTTRGSLTQASLRLMLPEHNGATCAKLLLEQSLFYPLHDRLIVAGRFRFGTIFRNKFEKILPHERFNLGGPNTVRGYQQDAIPPIGTSTIMQDGKEKTLYTIQGGSSMINANIEIRYAAYKSIGITLFQDVGILSQTGLRGLGKRWYPGSGIGLRYKLPIGTVRGDVGWRWKKLLPDDKKKPEWYITFSEAF